MLGVGRAGSIPYQSMPAAVLNVMVEMFECDWISRLLSRESDAVMQG
jgi:hypothetical protein